jgi:hypothetical protein
MKHGFRLMARITIDTDVVRENNQTYRLGWSENAKDGTKMGAGMPEYVLVFRKLPSDLSNAYADTPVTKPKESYTLADWQLDAAGFWRSDGNRLPPPETVKHLSPEVISRVWKKYSQEGIYNHEEHVGYCQALHEIGKLSKEFSLMPAISRNPDVWTDITRMKTLNTDQSARNREKHVCPLQLDIIKRLITRYSNPGDVILVPFQAVKMGRKAMGIDLSAEYWKEAVYYCEKAEAEMSVPTLFDLIEAV